MRRPQDHLAEPPVGRLIDPAAPHHRFEVVEDEIHGPVAAREDGVADDGLDPFDDGGFEGMTIWPVTSMMLDCPIPLHRLRKWHTDATGRVRSRRAAGDSPTA